MDTPLLPADRFDQAAITRWLLYEQTDVMPMIGGLRFRLVTGRFAPDSEAAATRRDGAHEVLGFLDAHLAEHDFLAAGRYTIADIAVYAYAHVADEASVDTDPYPHFRAWLERVESQPGFIDDLAPLSTQRVRACRRLDLRLARTTKAPVMRGFSKYRHGDSNRNRDRPGSPVNTGDRP